MVNSLEIAALYCINIISAPYDNWTFSKKSIDSGLILRIRACRPMIEPIKMDIFNFG